MATPTDGPTATSVPIIVEKATATDIPDLITVWWDSFSTEFIQRIYPQTPDGRRWLERTFARYFRPAPEPDEPTTECLMVRSPDTGTEESLLPYTRLRCVVVTDVPPHTQACLLRLLCTISCRRAAIQHGDRGACASPPSMTCRIYARMCWRDSLILWRKHTPICWGIGVTSVSLFQSDN